MSLSFPRADTLVDDVLAEIAAPPRRWRRPLLAAAALLVALAAAAIAVPDARHAVARWLGFDALRIEVVDRIPPDLVLRDAPEGVVVDTLPGQLDAGLYVKLVESGIQITPVDVHGEPGYWITGEPHVLMYRNADGDVREARLAGDTLVWQDGDVIRRVEGDISLDLALAIASDLGRG
jgi:hypothetical protein